MHEKGLSWAKLHARRRRRLGGGHPFPPDALRPARERLGRRGRRAWGRGWSRRGRGRVAMGPSGCRRSRVHSRRGLCAVTRLAVRTSVLLLLRGLLLLLLLLLLLSRPAERRASGSRSERVGFEMASAMPRRRCGGAKTHTRARTHTHTGCRRARRMRITSPRRGPGVRAACTRRARRTSGAC